MIYKMIYEWQTLLTGFIALIAAFIAARPVWNQLSWMRRQTIIQSREMFVSRRNVLMGMQQEFDEAFDGLIEEVEISSRVYKKVILDSFYGGDDDELNPDWAKEKEEYALLTIEKLLSMKYRYSYMSGLLELISKTCSSIEALKTGLFYIHFGCSIEFQMLKGDEEIKQDYIDKVTTGFDSAKENIPVLISHVDLSKKEIDSFLLDRLLKADDNIVECDLSLENMR